MEIMKMSAQEVVLLEKLTELAKEAIKASELIKEHFKSSFGLDNQEVLVFSTQSFGEYYGNGYLTINGIFKYEDNWWGGRRYEFSVTPDGIYHMLRSCYLRRNNLSHLDTEEFNCEIEHIDGYFRDFVESISKK